MEASNRYFTYRAYLARLFPGRVYKIPLDAGLTCPNRDGTVAVGGCSYCDNASFSPYASGPGKTISQQLEEGIAFYRGKRFAGEQFIAYFQAYTNTYAPPEDLAALYDEALSRPEVVGLAVGTRPDCVGEEVLDLLEEYQSRTTLFLELGLQSIHDRTLRRVNRGHTAADFFDAARRVKRRGIRLSVHTILGLPGETREEMLQTAEALASLPIDGVKITHLYIPAGAPIAMSFRKGEIQTLDFETYLDLVCDVLERLPSHVAIERLMGELTGPDILAPRWGKSKSEILRRIDARLMERGSRQGEKNKVPCSEFRVPT
jgi:radical SAM protein (TIGR01212 family)